MLPNLPLLAGDWEVESLRIPVIFGDWTQILERDPMRWSVIISAGDGGPFTLDTLPDSATGDGLAIVGGALELKYKDYGPLVQEPWFFFAKSVSPIAWIGISRIINRGGG